MTRPETVPGLAACSDNQPDAVSLRPDEPLVLLVHGCSSSVGRFRTLADVFEFHGQQTLCFNYNDRDSLTESASRLAHALRRLGTMHPSQEISVLGHSQGGLIARLALTKIAKDAFSRVRLVTVSSPFAGVKSATHCGWLPLHIASLGLTVAICQLITGSDWSEIHPSADVVEHPADLSPVVTEHVTIATDERNSCRVEDSDGRCEQDDFVFTVPEQVNTKMLTDTRARLVRVVSGHAAIVGEGGRQPKKLTEILQREHILRATPDDKQQAFQALLRRLYR